VAKKKRKYDFVFAVNDRTDVPDRVGRLVVVVSRNYYDADAVAPRPFRYRTDDTDTSSIAYIVVNGVTEVGEKSAVPVSAGVIVVVFVVHC
jgi:hypothetical protein